MPNPPEYIRFYRDRFMGSNRVNRRLNWLQRHIYLSLCLEAYFCETRPYLPIDDAGLALLADVPNDVWLEQDRRLVDVRAIRQGVHASRHRGAVRQGH